MAHALRLWLRRRWMSEYVHAFAWLLIAVSVIATYVCIHVVYKSAYEESISDALKSAVKLYHVRPNDQKTALELAVGNAVYDPSSDSPGPLGIGQLASVKGLLTETATALERYNMELANAITHVLNAFQAKTAYPGDMVARLSDIAPRAYNRVLVKSGEATQEQVFQIRIKEPLIRALRNRARNEATAQALVKTIRGGIVEKVVLSLPPDETTTIDEGVARILTNKPLKWVALKASSEVCENLRQHGRELRSLFGGEDVSTPESCISSDSCNFSYVYSAGTSGERGTAAELTPDCPLDMGFFHDTLKNFATEGVGFFWTAGNFRWIEVVALTILGVVVRRLIDFGVVFVRLRVVLGRASPTTHMWEPRESVRTVMCMVYAPILAVAVIWLLTATNLVPADAILFGDWTSHALVPTAFLLGLFPDLGNVLLTRVTEAVFGNVRGTEPPERLRKELEPPYPTERDVGQSGRLADQVDDAGDGPRSLESLRLRIRFIYTSLFR